ncbi:thiol:disulfide interchange protein precursor [compost metagenome]
MKRSITYLLLLFAVSFGYSQKSYTVSFKELEQKMAQQPRAILVKMYADWCTICKIQDKQIEKNDSLQQILSNNYYYLELNAESREPIAFNGTVYKFIPQGTGGLHELASQLGEAKSSYPAWVLLSPDYKIIARYNGLLKSSELIELLYFGK